MKSKEYLKEHLKVVGYPVKLYFWRNKRITKPIKVNFRNSVKGVKEENSFLARYRTKAERVKFEATKGTEVLKKKQVYRYVGLIKKEIEERIKLSDDYRMGNILDSDIKEWLNG